MLNTRGSLFLVAIIFAAAPLVRAADKPATDARKLEFFEKRIRPVLLKHCYVCHSQKSKKLRGGLLVDTRAGLQKGGESGPAVVAGDVEKSLLIAAIKHDGFEMPPKGKLPANVIADFVRWVKEGAVDPRDGKAEIARTRTIDIEQGRRFWAFQPVQSPPLPKVKRADWPRTAIDRFILHRLEEKGLSPVGDADRRTLIRRVTFDLTGLPPTPADIDRFVNDTSDRAFEKVVDRLLASPHFGEHWGRHWLDVARYADSNGGDINLTFRNAWRYRDYVIRSFNNDKRFNRFVIEQLAGDLLANASNGQTIADDAERARRSEQMIGSGFLVVGPKMLSERDKEKLRMDVVDEQLDSIGRTFLGLTIGCARCHDHKFDPIPTRDYYALAGIFRSTVTVQGIRMNNVNVSGWIERPLPVSPAHQKALLDHQTKLKQLTGRLDAINKQLGRSNSATVVAVKSLPGIVVDDVDAERVGTWKMSSLQKRYVGAGYVHDEKRQKGARSITFTPKLPAAGRYEVRISYAGGGGRDRKVPVEIKHAHGMKTVYVDQVAQPKIGGLFHSLGEYNFAAGRSGFVRISNTGTKDFVIADAVQFLPKGNAAAVAKASPKKKVDTPRRAALEKQRAQLTRALAELKKNAPRPAALCMAPQDREQPADCRQRIRGEPHNLGPMVPRGFLSVVDVKGNPKIDGAQSGRLEFARWIADARNPLTPRVIVNRIWHHLFGAGLVRSVDNFGKQGTPPTNPELLDRLADDFVRDGWSVKNAIRRVVLSRVYQLSSRHSAREIAADPRNRLLWRHSRRRLPAESIRDAMLAVSGRLDRKAGASSVVGLGEQAVANNLRDKTGKLAGGLDRRRSIYLPMVRNDLPDFLLAFDFADPDVVVGARSATTVPAQALLMLNSPFVKSQARHLATRALEQKKLSNRARLAWIYNRTLGRAPTRDEVDRATAYLAISDSPAEQSASLDAWSSFCHALLASTEFRFVE